MILFERGLGNELEVTMYRDVQHLLRGLQHQHACYEGEKEKKMVVS